MKFVPNGDLVLVQLVTADTESESGLDLSLAKSLDAELPLYAVVTAAGPDANYEEGDQILARRYTGIKVEVDGEEGYLFTDRDILGRFETE